MNQTRRKLCAADFKIMELPNRYRYIEWKDVRNQPNIKKMFGYLKRIHQSVEDGDSLLLTGGSNKKSELAAYLAKLCREYSYKVLWVSSQDVADFIKDGFQSWTGAYYSKRFREVDVLVIDDFGLDLITFNRSFVAELIRNRFKQAKTTIVTTEKSGIEIKEIYGKELAQFFSHDFLILECK